MLTVVTGWLLVVLGALLGAGGVWLALLGGSWAYIVLGIWLLITGVLLARRRRAGLAVYAAMLVATLIWALWEVGFDRWALIPRGAFCRRPRFVRNHARRRRRALRVEMNRVTCTDECP
jgi:quinoprotein glucose dehydrogenase